VIGSSRSPPSVLQKAHVTCTQCGHQRSCTPHVFAKMFGWDTLLVKIAARLRCSKCGARKKVRFCTTQRTH
jgi:hypothetical protein